MIDLALRKFFLHRDRIRRVTREASWIVAGQFISLAGILVSIRLLTEYLAPEEYGELALGITLAGLVNQVLMGGTAAGIGRFYSIAVDKKDLSGYLHAARQILFYSTLVVMAIGVVLITSLHWLRKEKWVGLVIAALAFSILSGYNASLNSIQNAARQRAIVALHAGTDSWLKILLAAILMLWLGETSTAVIVGYACSSFLVTVSQLFFLRRTIKLPLLPAENVDQWVSRISVYSLPLYTFGLFTWMQRASDRWALQVFVTPSEVGLYAVLFQLGFAPIALLTGMAISLLGPILYQIAGDGTDQIRNRNVHQLSWRTTKLFLIITLLGFLAAFALHEQLFFLLVAKEYRSMSYLFPWFVLAGGIFSAGQMLALKLMSEMKSSALIKSKVVTALVGALLNGIGAAFAGVQGVTGALVVFSCVYLFWMMALASRLDQKV
jgi:O-antigen/teichoic acid export membrane protein